MVTPEYPNQELVRHSQPVRDLKHRLHPLNSKDGGSLKIRKVRTSLVSFGGLFYKMNKEKIHDPHRAERLRLKNLLFEDRMGLWVRLQE